MAEMDKTITITSNLPFASAINILGKSYYSTAAAKNSTHQYKKAAAEHVVVIETVTEITHERQCESGHGLVLFTL